MTTTIPPATDAQLHDPSYTECIPDDYERDTAGDLAPPEDDWPEENTSDELPNYRGDTGAKKEDPMTTTTQPVQTLPSEIEYRYTADGLEDVESDRYAELVVEELRTVYGRSVRVIAAVEVDGTGDKRPWYPGGSDDNEEVIRDCAREAWERACSEPHVGDRVESHGTGGEDGADEIRCECGEADHDQACAWVGPIAKTVTVEYMPRQHRASHEAAGNSGRYPHNGAERLRVELKCATRLVEDNEGWASIIEERA